MNFYNQHKYRIISILLVMSLLLTSCITKRGPASDESLTLQSAENYERFDEAALKSQQEFEQLTEQLFKDNITDGLSLHYIVKDPTAYGLTDVPMTLGSYSVDELKKNIQDMKDLNEILAKINVKDLKKDQQLTYKILKSTVKAQLAGEGLELYEMPFTTTIGVQAQYPVLLAEYTFYNKQDVENYLTILSSIDVFYGQIMDFMKLKSTAGLMPSDTTIDRILASCEGYLLPADYNFMHDTFVNRINTLTDITEEERQAYVDRNLKVIEEHFIPAYRLLVDGMTALKGTAKAEGGLWNFPQGKQYYEYLVDSQICTSYNSIDDMKNAIQKQMNLDLMGIGKLINDRPDLLELMGDPSYKVTEPTEILINLQQEIQKNFPDLPECHYAVKQVPESLQNTLSPAFYLTPPMDNYLENVIYINGKYSNEDLYHTLAHEGYPGHLYQNVYFAANNTSKLRYLLSFPSYSEGWGFYAELNSYLFNSGLDSDLGKLLLYNSSQTLGLHALLDININYYGWTRDDVKKYMGEKYSITDETVIDDLFYTMIENPANYLKYYVGYLEISNMASTAKKKRGDAFKLKDFHTFILDVGPAPFDVIEEEFKYWLVQ